MSGQMRERRTLRGLAGMLLAMAGCVSAPPPDQPIAPAVQSYTPADAESAAAGTDASVTQRLAPGEALAQDWWMLFGSPEVGRIVRAALAHNRDVAAASATLEQARALADVQREAQGPQGEFTAGLGRQKYGQQFLGTLATIPPFSYFALGAAITDTIDFGNTSAHRIAQREALTEYERQQLRAAWLSVTGSAIGEWIDAASARAQLDAYDALLAEDRQRVDVLGQARAAGAVTAMQVAAAESQLGADEAETAPVRQQLARARTRLAVLQGLAPAAADSPATPLTSIVLPRTLPLTLPSELAHRRPDILAAEAQLRATTEALGIAHAAFYPHVTLSASTGLQSTRIGSLFDRDSGVFALNGGFSAPFLNRGALQSQQRAATQAMHASAARYEQTVLQAFGQVADALQSLDHDAAEVAARNRQSDAARREAELLRTSRAAGNTGILALLEAERHQRLAELDRTRAQARQLLDTVGLFVALGGADTAPP